MGNPKNLSYFAFAVVLLGVIILELGPVLMAGLFSYILLHFAYTLFHFKARRFASRWLAVFCFVVVTGAAFYQLGDFVGRTVSTFPRIVKTAMPKIMETAGRLRIALPFENIDELRVVAVDAVKTNAMAITKTSKFVTKGFFHILVGAFLAILYFLAEPSRDYKANLFDAVRKEFNDRLDSFLSSCERVIGAQVMISAVNTVLTAIFLTTTGIPYVGFLVPATFLLGILPIIGNVVSNTLIVLTALTISLKLAVVALIFLVVIHKLEYFLNSRIVGSSIDAPMWQTLLGILIGEVVMGVPGIILAPAVWHFIRKELRSFPSPAALTPAPAGGVRPPSTA